MVRHGDRTMKQRVLVLGAGGFIGRQVVAALSTSDWAAPIAAARRAGADPSGTIQVDATDAGRLREVMAGVDGVVNCVAGNESTIVDGARALFEAAGDLPQRPRVVHLSSMAVYGDRVGDVDESAASGTGLSPYGAAKFEAERLAAAGGFVTCLRLGIVYGPGSPQWSGRMAQLLRAHRLGDLGSAGDGICNLTYVGDAVQAILRTLRTPHAAGRIYNVAGPDFPTWNDYLSRYALALGAVPVARISRRRLKLESKLLAPPLKVAEILAARLAPRLGALLPQPIPPSLVRLFGQEIRMTVGLAERELGMEWTPLEKGLRTTADWYRGTHAGHPASS
jgi:nucleoside-diphosphate-sugar epimerase